MCGGILGKYRQGRWSRGRLAPASRPSAVRTPSEHHPSACRSPWWGRRRLWDHRSLWIATAHAAVAAHEVVAAHGLAAAQSSASRVAVERSGSFARAWLELRASGARAAPVRARRRGGFRAERRASGASRKRRPSGRRAACGWLAKGRRVASERRSSSARAVARARAAARASRRAGEQRRARARHARCMRASGERALQRRVQAARYTRASDLRVSASRVARRFGLTKGTGGLMVASAWSSAVHGERLSGRRRVHLPTVLILPSSDPLRTFPRHHGRRPPAGWRRRGAIAAPRGVVNLPLGEVRLPDGPRTSALRGDVLQPHAVRPPLPLGLPEPGHGPPRLRRPSGGHPRSSRVRAGCRAARVALFSLDAVEVPLWRRAGAAAAPLGRQSSADPRPARQGMTQNRTGQVLPRGAHSCCGLLARARERAPVRSASTCGLASRLMPRHRVPTSAWHGLEEATDVAPRPAFSGRRSAASSASGRATSRRPPARGQHSAAKMGSSESVRSCALVSEVVGSDRRSVVGQSSAASSQCSGGQQGLAFDWQHAIHTIESEAARMVGDAGRGRR